MSLAIAMECSWDETMLLKPKQDHIPTFISQKHTIMHKSKKKIILRGTNRHPDYFSFFLLKEKKKLMNDQNKNKKRHKTRTDGVVKNDHKTSSYNW